MVNKQPRENCGEGVLPAVAPLANPYVPFQIEKPTKYNAGRALIRGTLYPGLDLPFMGMVNKNELPVTAMSQMQAYSFVVQELALYLDTHRDDYEALEMYQQYQRMLEKSKKEYERKHGPTCHESINDSHHYEWLKDPWPWEYSKNREV